MSADFAFGDPATLKLETEFLDIVDTHAPFFAVSNSLIDIMERRNVTFFDIPAHRTFCKKWIRFHFTTRMEGSTRLYYYERLEKFDKNPK